MSDEEEKMPWYGYIAGAAGVLYGIALTIGSLIFLAWLLS